MAISVSLIVAGGDGAELDTRHFDAVPRTGEVIIFTEGVDMRTPQTFARAECVVTEVRWDYRVYSPDRQVETAVHAWVTISPQSDDDREGLAKLYPGGDVGLEETDANKG